MKPVRVEVNDKMQKAYVYFRTKPIGRAFRRAFKPELSPKQMLELGIFGGKYMTDCRKEFPPTWFTRAKLSQDRHRASLNCFDVNASLPLTEWRRKGWIPRDDPRGWFQWYCRYYCGRRHEDDLRQISRWRAVRRHVAQLRKNCKPAISLADAGNARRCCTGATIREKSDQLPVLLLVSLTFEGQKKRIRSCSLKF